MAKLLDRPYTREETEITYTVMLEFFQQSCEEI